MAKWMRVKGKCCRMCGGELRYRKRNDTYEVECLICWDWNAGITLASALWAASRDGEHEDVGSV